MIHNHVPDQRLEPNHHEDYGDEFEADFIQPNDDVSDESILDIYEWLMGLEQ